MSHAPRIPTARVRAPPLTHFIGLSLVTPVSRPQLQASIDTFRDAARNEKDLHIPEVVAMHAIRPVDTLHLTICTFSLPEREPERLQEVIQHLKDVDFKKLWQEAYFFKPEAKHVSDEDSVRHNQGDAEESIQAQTRVSNLATSATDEPTRMEQPIENTPPLCVTLKGISTMRSPKSTTVVYAPPSDPTGSLQRFCNSIREDFRPFLPGGLPDRNLKPDATDQATEESQAQAQAPTPNSRPTLESFPHPDSYKSDISILASPASASSAEPSLPGKPSAEAIASPLSWKEPHLSKRQQKRLAKKDLPFINLHATLLNTIYVRKHNRKDRRPITIDAQPLLERFNDIVWMKDVQIEKLCLYRMGAKEMLDESGKGTEIVRYVAEAERDLVF